MIKGILFMILVQSLVILSFLSNVTVSSESDITDYELITEDLPESFSWRNIEGIDYTTQVKDQEPCAACEAFAALAIVETLVHDKLGYSFDCDLSEAHLFFWNNGTCDLGVNITEMLNYLMNYGVPDEGCFPYSNRFRNTPKNETLPDWEDRSVKINGWGWVENNSISIKKALIKYGPLGVLIMVSLDLGQYNGGVFYPKTKLYPAHWVTLVGYNDSQRCWILKNSFGPHWGKNGWFKLSYDADIITSGNNTFIEHVTGGGTGIFYIDGVYGNFQPDVPQVKIVHPKRSYTYWKEKSWKNLIFKIPLYNDVYIFFRTLYYQQKLLGRQIFDIRVPKIFRGTYIEVNATGNNITKVEIYVNNVLKYSSDLSDFRWYWDVDVKRGRHEIKAIAYDENGIKSKDVIDVYTFK